MRPRYGTTCAGLLIAGLILAGIAPAVHAHEADAHHPHTIVHRHAEPHASTHHVDDASDCRMGSEDAADHDEDAVWILTHSVQRSKVLGVASTAVLSRSSLLVVAAEGQCLLVSRDDSLPHGPPGAPSQLRGPPPSVQAPSLTA